MSETVIAGRYRLDELLGRGGMSEVWRAEDLELGRDVAIKLLAPDADTARFDREARAVASLAHPNVVQLYDYGESEGRPYMVLECVPAGTLEDRLRDGAPLTDDEAYEIAVGIAAGLAHAHARGVVHRDLKPANVLFDGEGRPKVADFGIARLATGEGTLTEAGTLLGTAAYISPEQAAGEPASSASDVYSFGVLLYRMLAGRLPFESKDPMELVLMHRDALPPPLAEHRADLPERLESTVAAALAKAPAERPHDGAALLAALGAPAGGSLTSTAPLDGEPTRVLPAVSPPPFGPGPEPPSTRRRVPLAIGALLVLALAGGALAYEVTRPASSPAAPPSTQSPRTTPARTTQPATTTTAPVSTSSTGRTTTEATTTRQTQPATTSPPPTTTPPTTLPTTAPPPPPTTTPPTTAPPPTTDTTTTTSALTVTVP
jgi:eukaryotic-like serine/threonine-protein kinase